MILISVAMWNFSECAKAQLADDALPIAPRRYDSLADVPQRLFGPPRGNLSQEVVWHGTDDTKSGNRAVAGVSNQESVLRAKVGPKIRRK
ncbi:MAG: hypothetical protein KDD25_09875 [Bdellovibrionales bacterium]|nr:hypothetical protein [Bdellovibrionales bacterium]